MSDTPENTLVSEIAVPPFIREGTAVITDVRVLPWVTLAMAAVTVAVGSLLEPSLNIHSSFFTMFLTFGVLFWVSAFSGMFMVGAFIATIKRGLPWRVLNDPRRAFVDTAASEIERFNADARIVNQLHQARRLGGSWTAQDDQFVAHCMEQRERLERVVAVAAILAQSGPLGTVDASSASSRRMLTETFDADALREHGTRLHETAMRRNADREVERS